MRAITLRTALAALAVIAAFASLPAATAQAQSRETECRRDSTGGVLGGLAGAALGGLIGSQFGSGSGKTAATIGGAVLGGLAGNEIGRRMTCRDEEYVRDTTYESLETGEEAAWENEESGNRGVTRPGETFINARGQQCRTFEQEIYVDGRAVRSTGTACKQPDGSWQVVS